jgi:hypothetical protein
MRSSIFQRSAVSIFLIGTLLAPFGNCLQPTHKKAHSCCTAGSAQGKTAQSNCCTTSAPLPAVAVAPIVPAPTLIQVARQFIASDELCAPNESPKLVVIPPHSPPAGTFILRI